VPQVDLASTHNSGLALPGSNCLQRQVHSRKTRAAGRVGGYRRSAEIEMVTDPIGNHGGGAGEGASGFVLVLLPLCVLVK
jgi:hypothetical protein